MEMNERVTQELLRRIRKWKDGGKKWEEGWRIVERVGEALSRAKAKSPKRTQRAESIVWSEVDNWLCRINAGAKDEFDKGMAQGWNYHGGIPALLRNTRERRNRIVHDGLEDRRIRGLVIKLVTKIGDRLHMDRTEHPVGDYMTTDVIMAHQDETWDEVRQKMLEHDISALPIDVEEGDWRWVTAPIVAVKMMNGEVCARIRDTTEDCAWIGGPAPGELAKGDGVVLLPYARCVTGDTDINEVLQVLEQTEPGILVTIEERKKVIGIITAFDLLVARWKRA